MPLSQRLGALQERDFRLLFAGTTITTIGDRLAGIALAFAVLDMASATALGIVFAVRQGVQALVVVGGGVLSDRIPRNLVLVGASLVQGTAQAATAACVLTGTGGVGAIVALQAVYGIGLGLVLPAEVGLVPQTVSPARLQQANALQGMSRNMIGVLGPAVGGVVVVVSSPGIALAIDAVSFLVCADLLRRIRVAPRDGAGSHGFVHELREGWQEFTSRTWLWASVLLFGIGNLAFAGWIVLGPAIADERLGGAGPWAVILTAGGVGAVHRRHPRHPDQAPSSARRLRPRRDADLPADARPRPERADPGDRRGVVRRRHRDRRAPDALVHGLPAAGAGARAVAGRLVRHARVVRPDADRDGARRPARRRDRHRRDALAGAHRDVGVVGGDPAPAVRVGDPAVGRSAGAEPGVTRDTIRGR